MKPIMRMALLQKEKFKTPALFVFFTIYYIVSGAILLFAIRETFRFNGFLVMLPVGVIGGTIIALFGDYIANHITRR